MTAHRKVCSLVICVYQNAGSVPALCERLREVEQQLDAMGVTLEVVFSDDGSDDGSAAALLAHAPPLKKFKVVRLTRNFGAVPAFKAALTVVTGDCIVNTSADLQDDPGLIPRMVAKWLAGARYVRCERTTREDPVGTKIGSWIYYILLRKLAFRNYPRTGFDVFLIDRQFFPIMRAGDRNSNMQALTSWIGVPAEVIEYERKARRTGKSRWTLAKKIKHFLDTITSFSYVPIRLISAIGVVVSLLSFAYGTWVLIHSLMYGYATQGWASLMIVISFLLGLTMVMLGVIGEYVWRVLDQVRPRGEFVVDEVVSVDASEG